MWEDIYASTGETAPIIDNGVAGYYGPQNDGTYQIPQAAQQYNSPANTAGYSSPMSQQTYGLLSQGLGILGQSFNMAQILDYKKYEATNGGLFMSGQYAGGYKTGQVVNPNYSMLLLLVIGAAFVMRG